MKSVLRIAAYQAGSYHKIRPDVADMAEQYVSLAEKAIKRGLPKKEPRLSFYPPCVFPAKSASAL